MDTQKLCELLARLTGSPVDPGSTVTLSSVQQGAFAALARKSGMAVDRNRIKTPFSPEALAGGVSVAASAPATTGHDLVPVSQAGAGTRIGCDVQSIVEFGKGVQAEDYKSCPFLSCILSPEEISRCENQPDALQSLCGVFSAKEAIRKAGDRRELRDIVITHDTEGAPASVGYSVSISHSGDTCFAVALRV